MATWNHLHEQLLADDLRVTPTQFMTEILYRDSNGYGWKRLSKSEDLATNLDELAKEGASIESIKR